MKNSLKQSSKKLLALGLSLFIALAGFSTAQAQALRKIYYITAGGTGGTPAVGDSLWVANSDGTSPSKIVDATSFANPNALALDMANNRAFVADSFGGQQAIYTVNLNTGATALFLSTTGNAVNAMEADASNGYLYYLTANAAGGSSPASGDGLFRIGLNGTGNTQIFNATTLINPSAMALDTANNRAFVADSFNGVQAIYTVNLTTGAIATFLTKTNLSTNGMRLDAVNGKLYYITAATGSPGVGDSLWRVNLDGTGDTKIQDNSTIANSNALEIDVPGNRAIVADSFAGQQNLYSIDLTSGAVTTFIAAGLTSRGVLLAPVTVTTQAATSVTGAGATLNGLINAQNGSTQNVSFDYGTSTAYGSNVAATPATVSGAADTAVSAAISGLTAGTTYHFRVKTQSGVGADMTFTTSAASAAGVLAIGTAASNQLSSSLSYTVPAGTNRLLVVWLAQDLVPGIPAPTFNSQTMTLGVHKDDGTTAGDSIFYLKLGDGDKITSTITATANAAFIAAQAYTNVDQTAPVSSPLSFNNTSGGNDSTGLNVTSATGDLVVDVVDTYSASTVTAGGGQTVLHSQQIPAHSAFYKTSTKPGAATVNVSWTSNGTAIIHAALNIHSRAAFTAPTITTLAATGVTSIGATLNGTLNAQGTTAVSTFDIGTTTGYGITFGGVPITVTGSSGTAVTQTLSGLTPNTLYHFRANAINGTTVNGGDLTFTTAAATPTVTASASNINANATNLTINGTNFDSTFSNNTVALSSGTGSVVGQTGGTSLNFQFATAPKGGPLTAIVTTPAGNSGSAVQVATVIPVVTTNTSNISNTATTLTINGVGFDTTMANNTVAFGGGATGTVTAATSTSLTIGSLTGLTNGALNAVVTVNGSASASTQVATVFTPPNLTINDVTQAEGNAGTSNFTFTVSLSAPAPTGGVTFDIATQDGSATTADSDYVAQSLTSQTIAAGNSTYTFTVVVNGDTKFEPNESFFVNVTNVTNAVVTDGVGQGTITNDDAQPNLTIGSVTASEGNAGTSTLTFTVTLSAASSQTVSVLAYTGDGTATTADTDYVAKSQTLTFTPGTTSQTFGVTLNGDTKFEADETFYVHLAYPVNATLGSPNIGQGTINNDDAGTAGTYTVTTNTDPDPSTYGGLNLTNGKIGGGNTVTLRSAVLAANQNGAGPHVINVPASVGTITLTATNPLTPGTTSTNGGKDLVVGSNFSTIIIQGTGGTATIVGPGSGSDVITTGLKSDGFTPCIVNLSLDHLDISGGAFTGIFVGADDGLGNPNSVSRTQITNCNIHNNTNTDATFGQGGAIQDTNGYLTISDTIFSNNTATNSSTGQGGAIFYWLPNASGQGSVGALSINNCTFTSNSAARSGGTAGGAIYAEIASSTGSNLAIKGCTFTTNSATAGDGGAVVVSSARTVDITNNNFVSNSVSGSGHGGAIYVNTGVSNVNFNRFISNTAATAANGKTLYRNAGATGLANATINWWGVNSGAGANDIVGTFNTGNNINLKIVASPTTVPLLGTSALTADFFTTSSATTITLAQVSALIGLPVNYGAPLTLGTLSGSDTILQANGTAVSTYNAGSTSGPGTASITVDSQTVTANITVGSGAAGNSSLTNLLASAGALSPAFSGASTGPYAVSAPNATTTTTITPTATNSNAAISYNVNGGGFTAIASAATSAAITLNAAGTPTPITVKVISQDTTTTTIYTLNVTRQAAGNTPATIYTSGVDSPPGAPGTSFGSIRSGMTIASSGALAFRGFLTIGGSVDANNYQGMWKSPDGTSANVALVARSGSTAPDTGSGLFDVLPVNAVINNAAQTSFLGFVRVNTGSPTTTTSNDTGVWSELGGGGLHLMLREGAAITGGTVTNVAPSTWVATGATKAAFTVQFASGSALVRGGITGGVGSVTTLATEGGAAPGGGTFDSFAGNSADPRMDATDDIAFLGYLQTSGTPGIWYQSAAGSLVLAVKGGQTTAGIADTYTGFERPSLGKSTEIAFRAFLSTNSQAVFRGDPSTPASILPVAVNGYTSAQIATIPASRKLWSIWSPFSNSAGHITFRASLVDTAGNTNETRAILADTSGTMAVIAKAGDAAPGTADTFDNFDHPVIGDGDQVAFTASTAGGIVGLWRQAASGGALSLIVKVGDTFTINSVTETVASISVPGASSSDRLYETKTMDSAGHVLIYVTYQSGKTGMILSGP